MEHKEKIVRIEEHHCQ